MPRFILIETSTSLCSVALSEDGKILEYREDTQRQHSSLTAPFIDEMLKGRSLKVNDMDAVCLSMGPGSFTGLRVGSSTAKGLCFGGGVPLVAVSSLDVLVGEAIMGGLIPEGCKYVVPMIDARRMEVYTAVFTPNGERLSDITPLVVEEGSFSKELYEGKVLFIGDGAEKCSSVIRSENAVFVGKYPSAKGLLLPATREFGRGSFQDVAYFEPFYLKDFIATQSRKKLF